MALQNSFNSGNSGPSSGEQTMYASPIRRPLLSTLRHYLMALFLGVPIPFHAASLFASDDINETLRLAVIQRDFDGIKAALSAGADPSHIKEGGASPLRIAAIANNPSIVRILMEGGANPNEIGNRGNPTVFSILSLDHIDVLQTFLDFGLDVHISDTKEIWTPLALASRFSSIDTIRLLLEHGADPNHRAEHGPLPIAGLETNRKCEVNCFRLLIDWGANLFEYEENKENILIYFRDTELREKVINYYHETRRESKK